MRKITFGLLMLVLVFAVAGCAKPPEQDINAAKAAIEAAQQAGASDYAPESLNKANDLKAQLDAELKTQEEKFALFRSYKKATELAQQAKAAGETAATDAATKKEQVKAEAQTLINDAKTALTEAQDMLAKAPKGKGTQADIEAMKNDLTTAGTALTDAETSFNGERYLDAKSKAEAVKNQIAGVKSAVEQAIAAKSGKK